MPRGRSSSVDVGQCRYWRFARTDGTSSFPAALPVRYESVPNLINSIIDDFAPADFVFFVIRSAVLNRRRTVAERVCIHRGMAAHRTFSALLEYYGISVSRKTVLTAGELKFTRNILNVKNRKLSVRNRRNFLKKKKKIRYLREYYLKTWFFDVYNNDNRAAGALCSNGALGDFIVAVFNTKVTIIVFGNRFSRCLLRSTNTTNIARVRVCSPMYG